MNKNIVDGSTALNPQQDERSLKEERIKQKRKERELLNKKRQSSLNKKAHVLLNIGITFVVSMILIMRFAYICNYRNEIVQTQKKITTLNKENENLKVELLKYDNIKYVEKIAVEKLHMQKSNLSNVDYCDLQTQYFKENAGHKGIKANKKLSIIDVVKSKLF